MEYALWYLVMGDLGTDHFRGWFDAIMTFFFYIPNLAVAEFFIRAGTGKRAGKSDTPAALLLLARSEEHTSELQSLMRISYAVFCLKKQNTTTTHPNRMTVLNTHVYKPARQVHQTIINKRHKRRH